MPTEYQSGTNDWRNEAHRFLASEMDLAPLIRGVDDVDRIVLYWNEANKIGASETVKRQIRQRMEYLRDNET